MAEVKCKVCCEFREQLVSLRNYHSAFIKGTDNVRSSAVVDHAQSAILGHVHESDGYLPHQDSSAEPTRVWRTIICVLCIKFYKTVASQCNFSY